MLFGKLKPEAFCALAWEAASQKKRDKLEKKLKETNLDQAFYLALAKRAVSPSVRTFAVTKIKDAKELLSIAQTDADSSTRFYALRYIETQGGMLEQTENAALLKIVKTDADWSVRRKAIDLLTKKGIVIDDESILLDIIANCNALDALLMGAIKALKTQATIDAVASGTLPSYPPDKNPDYLRRVRSIAAKRPLSKDVAEKLAGDPREESWVRQSAILQVEDAHILERIFFDSREDYYVKATIACSVKNDDLIEKIFNNCDDIVLRLKALHNLLQRRSYDDISNQNALADAVTTYERVYKFKDKLSFTTYVNEALMKRLIERITDQEILVRVFLSDVYFQVSNLVLEKIHDDAVLYEIALDTVNYKTPEVVERIQDQYLLLQLAKHYISYESNFISNVSIESNLLDVYKVISLKAESEELKALTQIGIKKYQPSRDPFTDDHKEW